MTGCVRSLLLGCFIVTLASCSASPTAPTFKTDTFSGTLQAQGKDYHDFTVSADSYIDVTIANLSPNVVVGTGIGVDSSGAFALNASNEAVTMGSALQISVAKRTYCVEVHNVGNVTTPVAYTVTVDHP